MFCITKLVSRFILTNSVSTIAGTTASLSLISSSIFERKFSSLIHKHAVEGSRLFDRRKVGFEKIHFVLASQGFHHDMSYFVIGMSGVTCGGKTTMSKLIQRSFPWCRVIHQDMYFYPKDYPGHVRLPEINDHINFDNPAALNMDKMYEDVEKILRTPPQGKEINGVARNGEIAPNFAEGLELLRNLADINIDTSKYSNIPILIIEGFTMFEYDDLYDKFDIRFFLTLDEETCRHRRSLRVFDPPDGEGYFDHCIWPEYQKHYKHFIEDRAGIQVLSGKTQISSLWKESVEHIIQKMEEKFAYKLNKAKENL